MTPKQELEKAAGLQRTVADKKTISRIADRAVAAGHAERTLMRLQGANARDKVRTVEVLVCAGVPLNRALLAEVRACAPFWHHPRCTALGSHAELMRKHGSANVQLPCLPEAGWVDCGMCMHFADA